MKVFKSKTLAIQQKACEIDRFSTITLSKSEKYIKLKLKNFDRWIKFRNLPSFK